MVGQTISHYRITAELGQGGMGVVYRAEDTTLGRTVALKFLRPDVTSNQWARDRLLREAKLASRLNHPNIATIYEIDETDQAMFIAMELVNGESLGQVLLRGACPPNELPTLARGVAEGLNAAHESGVLHRDIKPGNIILAANGGVKILDFGLAVLARREQAPEENFEEFTTRTTNQLSTAGTIPYMSPEQLRGELTDARSDIFSFGVLLYECVAGRLPFPGQTAIDVNKYRHRAYVTSLDDARLYQFNRHGELDGSVTVSKIGSITGKPAVHSQTGSVYVPCCDEGYQGLAVVRRREVVQTVHLDTLINKMITPGWSRRVYAVGQPNTSWELSLTSFGNSIIGGMESRPAIDEITRD